MKAILAVASLLSLVAVASVPDVIYASHSGNPKHHWVPRRGTSVVRADGDGDRFLNQFFKWDFDYQHENLDEGNVTLEVETHFDNRDGQSYFSHVLDEGAPQGTFWDTDLPDAYYDTSFGDDGKIRRPTVGSSETTDPPMITGHMYSVFVYFIKGNSRVDRTALRFEEGHRDPFWCHSTWCIFGDSGEYVIGGFGDYRQAVPGQMNWTWPN